MECPQARQILSEYVDGILDLQAEEELERHLKNCKRCRKEYASLKIMINEIRNMDTVEAPANFLEKVNDKIEASSFFERIRRLFLLPTRLKVPLEITGLAVMAVFVVLLFGITHPDKKDINLNPGQDKARIAGISDKETQGMANSSSGNEFKMGSSPIHISLILEPKNNDQPLPSENVLLTNRGHEPSTRSIPETPFNTDRRNGADTQAARIISDLKEIIILTRGRILSGSNDTPIDNDGFIHAEIPASDYYSFLDKIEKIANVQKPAPEPLEGYQGKFLFKIKVES